MSAEVLLPIALSAAVPLWIEKLRNHPRGWKYIQERSQACAQVIAEKGDIIQYRSKKSGQTAYAFNHLAEGLACASFASGGVRFMGLHFEAHLPGQEPKKVPKRPRALDDALEAFETKAKKPRPF